MPTKGMTATPTRKKPVPTPPKAHSILSLDLGTTCGWCLVKDGVARFSGTLALPGPKEHPGRRFLRFGNWLNDFRGVNEIFYEDVPRFESAKAARVYCGLLSILQVFCLQHGIRMSSIKSNSVKKEFTGNGNAKKPVMCQVAHRLGWRGGHPGSDVDHDEADAIACAWVVLKRRECEMAIDQCKT